MFFCMAKWRGILYESIIILNMLNKPSQPEKAASNSASNFVAPKKDPKKEAETLYKAREMDAKKEKEKKDRENKQAIWEGDIRSENAELRAQENTLIQLRQQIARLESSAQNAVNSNTEATLETQALERKLEENKKKLQTFEKNTPSLTDEFNQKTRRLAELRQHANKHDDSAENLLIQKEQNEKKNAQLLAQLQDEIKKKGAEVEKFDLEHKKVESEIARLRDQQQNSGDINKREQNQLESSIRELVSKAGSKKAEMEKIKSEISILTQKLEDDKRKLMALEQEIPKLDAEYSDESRRLSQVKQGTGKISGNDMALVQKEREAEKDAELVLRLKEEVRLKSLESEKLGAEEVKMKNEILKIKSQKKSPNSSLLREQAELEKELKQITAKMAGENTSAEKIKNDIAVLTQQLSTKKQEVDRRKGSGVGGQSVKELTDKAVLVTNRIKAIKQNLGILSSRIKGLKN